MGSDQRSLERNVALYPLYQVLFNCYFWLPVFFLYFSEHMPLTRVLQLEAIYYATVVLLEIPSGYFSDTFGRRKTLIISSSGLVAAYALFFLGSGFQAFTLAQVCLAVGISFNSGTDTSLHFDTLSALNRSGEYGAREAQAHRFALLGRALAALLGGLLATWQLGHAYGLSLVAAVGVVATVLMMVEPPREHAPADETGRRGFWRQIASCIALLKNRTLAWLLAFAVLMIVINHVPYEFYQPYIDALLDGRTWPAIRTPLVTGLVTAVTMVIASVAAARSIRLRNRIGLAPTLLLTTTLQVLIIAAMGWWLHEAVLGLILLRSVPAALMEPPLRAAVMPQVPQTLRATYLSMQSLVGRLGFSGTLVLLALNSDPGPNRDWPAISSMSLTCAAVGFAGLVVLIVTSRAAGTRLDLESEQR